MRKQRLHLDPYTGDPVLDRGYHGIPVENHRRVNGGKRKRSRSVQRVAPRDVTRVGTLILSIHGAVFDIVRTHSYRNECWTPRALEDTRPVQLANRNRGHASARKGYEDASAPSPKSDASDYAPTIGNGENTVETNEQRTVLYGLAAFRERQRLYKASKRT